MTATDVSGTAPPHRHGGTDMLDGAEPPEGDPGAPLPADDETRHRLRRALRILVAARRRDDGGSGNSAA